MLEIYLGSVVFSFVIRLIYERKSLISKLDDIKRHYDMKNAITKWMTKDKKRESEILFERNCCIATTLAICLGVYLFVSIIPIINLISSGLLICKSIIDFKLDKVNFRNNGEYINSLNIKSKDKKHIPSATYIEALAIDCPEEKTIVQQLKEMQPIFKSEYKEKKDEKNFLMAHALVDDIQSDITLTPKQKQQLLKLLKANIDKDIDIFRLMISRIPEFKESNVEYHKQKIINK